MAEDQITILLTTPEAILFRDFQQFHQTFALLCTKGVFDMRNGSVTLHFDQNGTIQKIDRHDSLFDARAKVGV